MPETVTGSRLRHPAGRFVLLLGVVALFADLAYEGARSAAGPFLALLGATGAAVGAVAGFGEFVGYGLRFLTGRWADRSQAYWPITILGFAVQLAPVPLLAFAGSWQVAAALLVLERTGKAIRNPARDAMLSHAAHEVGAGWAFGLHNALDKLGAALGPLVLAATVTARGDYRLGFLLLGIAAVAAVATLLLARRLNPRPHDLEPAAGAFPAALPRRFWLYLGGSCLLAVGFADFPLMAYHLSREGVLAEGAIPLLYSMAMAADAVAAVALGRALDAWGPRILLPCAALPVLSAPLVFLGGPALVVAGVALWGLGVGAQASTFRAVVRGLVPSRRRASAFGAYDGLFGVAWFLGSASMGFLVDRSLAATVALAVAPQLAALPLLARAARPADPAGAPGVL